MPSPRIAIWGNSGSGKSTLAELAGDRAGLPVFHVDLIAWEQNWHFRPESEFLALQRPWLEQPRWIIEGVGGWSGLVERFAQADLIVHLDTPVAICHERAAQRIGDDRMMKNRFMAAGCRYGDVVEKQAEVIRHFDESLCDRILTLLAANFAGKRQVRLDGAQPLRELCRRLLAHAGHDPVPES